MKYRSEKIFKIKHIKNKYRKKWMESKGINRFRGN